MTMRALKELSFLIRYLPPDAATVQLNAPEFQMDNTRDMTLDDIERMHPSLFMEN